MVLILYTYFVGYMLVCPYAIKISQPSLAWGNEKDLTPRTGRIFPAWDTEDFSGRGGGGMQKSLWLILTIFLIRGSPFFGFSVKILKNLNLRCTLHSVHTVKKG